MKKRQYVQMNIIGRQVQLKTDMRIGADQIPMAQQRTPAPGQQGKNSWGMNDYGGPCPPSGKHRYFFKLYALDTKLELGRDSTKKDVERAMEGHILDKTQLIGLYEKS